MKHFDRRTKLLPLLVLISFSIITIQAQHSHCLTDEKKDNLNNPSFKQLEASFESFSKYYRETGTKRSSTLKVIPVHIIVVHSPGKAIGQAENINESLIASQLEILNRDFNRLNTDSTKTPQVFSTGAMNIAFCLADIDPFGNKTNGITRYPTSLNFEVNETIIKESTGWSRSEYLNIWVADIGVEKKGWAYIPTLTTLPDEKLDGVAVNYRNFGNNNLQNKFASGRTAVHEVGHFLGLQHIWGSNGCLIDDGIADTPRQDTANLGCPVHPKLTCDTIGDMFMNYMDYTADSCTNAFTKMQASYMDQILENSRFSLINSKRSTACKLTDPLTISGAAQTLPSCFNKPDGRLEPFVIGGKKPYRFFINDVASDTSVFTQLVGGTYKIKVIDADGAADSANYILFQPEKVTTFVTKSNYSSCLANSDTLELNVVGSGGLVNILGYTFSIGQTTNRTGVFKLTKPGIYSILTSDLRNCVDTLTYELKPKPYRDTIPTIVTQIKCSGDINGKIEVLGNNSNYSYTLGSLTNKTGIFEPLIQNIYSLRVTDSLFGCIYEKNILITDPPKLVINSVATVNLPCNLPDTSKLTINAMGGIAPFKYSIGGVFQNSNVFERIPVGVYTPTIQDARGCVTTFKDQVLIIQTGGLRATFASEDAFCSNNPSGRVLLSATGGSGAYNYYFNGNASSNIINNLRSGTYTFTVEDRNSRCLQNQTITIGIRPAMKVTLDRLVVNPNRTLQFTFFVTGGMQPYLYSIDGGFSYKSIPIFDNVPEGNTVVTVLDNFNCRVDVPLFLSDNEVVKLEDVKVYPNPFDNEIVLDLGGQASNLKMIKLYNQNGLLVKSYDVKNNVTNDKITLSDVSELPFAVYYLCLVSDAKNEYVKVIKK